ncbi:MAG: small multi-drug export protein [Candidatus Pacebacteria bacterium]|nr:small multi-drug export protein [Candidatus Paceibacterota bacterium]
MSTHEQDNSTASLEEDGIPDTRTRWSAIRKSQEAVIFLAGVVCALTLALWVLVLTYRDPGKAGQLLTIIGSHLSGGRAAGIALGLNYDMHRATVILLGTLIETGVVCIFFSLFSLSFKKLITSRFQLFTDTMNHIHASAKRQRWRLLRWGIPGLILFVWFPFFMTGPVVGSVLGYLIGMQPWVTVTVVLFGTLLALVSWTFLMGMVVDWLASVGQFLPLVIVLFLLILAVSYRMNRFRELALGKDPTHSGNPPDDHDKPSRTSHIKIVLTLGVVSLITASCATYRPRVSIQVDLSNAEITVPKGASQDTMMAANELAMHLGKLGATTVPIHETIAPQKHSANLAPPYVFRVGTKPSGWKSSRHATAGSYLVTPQATYFFATTKAVEPTENDHAPSAEEGDGLLAAVYAFLHDECGIRWMFPGNEGIYIPEHNSLLFLQSKTTTVQACLSQRHIGAESREIAVRKTLLARVTDQTGMKAETLTDAERMHRMWLRRNRIASPTKPVTDAPTLSALVSALPSNNEHLLFRKTRDILDHPDAGIHVTGIPGGGLAMLRDFALVRLLADPHANFADIARTYFEQFGTAAEQVRKYHRYWRDFYRTTIASPLSDKLQNEPKDRSRAFLEGCHQWYSADVFEESGAILQHALTASLTREQSTALERLMLAHEHAALTYQTIRSLDDARTKHRQLTAGILRARHLHAFRHTFRQQLTTSLPMVIAEELRAGDITGYELADACANLTPLTALSGTWRYAPGKRSDDMPEEDILNPSHEALESWPEVPLTRGVTAPPKGTDKNSEGDGKGELTDCFARSITIDVDPGGKRTYYLVAWAVVTTADVYLNGNLLGTINPTFGNVPATVRMPIPTDILRTDELQTLVVKLAQPSPQRLPWRALWVAVK